MYTRAVHIIQPAVQLEPVLLERLENRWITAADEHGLGFLSFARRPGDQFLFVFKKVSPQGLGLFEQSVGCHLSSSYLSQLQYVAQGDVHGRPASRSTHSEVLRQQGFRRLVRIDLSRGDAFYHSRQIGRRKLDHQLA